VVDMPGRSQDDALHKYKSLATENTEITEKKRKEKGMVEYWNTGILRW